MTRRLVLASGSPRRRDLLRQAGFDFDLLAPGVVEIRSSGLTARELTLCNALRKGRAVLRQRSSDVVLAADTVVAIDHDVLGKPAGIDQAREFIRRLSGRTHQVYSSVFIADAKRERLVCELSHVSFRPLMDNEITAYFRKIDPLDKAGGYAAQGDSAEIIHRIDGSYTNVVGLPMERTIELLREFGITSKNR